MWTCFKFSPMKNIFWKLRANESLIMASLQFYLDILLLTIFLWVNSSDVYYLSWQSKCPNLKTTCHIKLSFFLSTELLENLLLPKCLISVDVALIKLNFYYELTWNEMNTNIWEWFFISCYFTTETSSAPVISGSQWVNAFLFHKARWTMEL